MRDIVCRHLLRALWFVFAVGIASQAKGEEYGHYDLKKLLVVSETATGISHAIDMIYLDHVLGDLFAHAGNYPPTFDSVEDAQRAKENLVALSKLLDMLTSTSSEMPANGELLRRSGAINAIAHNLDIPGAAQKAKLSYLKLLSMSPSDPQANYMYGAFLAGVNEPKDALHYLEKAYSLGVSDASYAIGVTYLSLGDKDQALEHLEIFRKLHPDAANVDILIQAIKSGNVKFKRH